MGGSISLLIVGVVWTAGTVMIGLDMGEQSYRQYQTKDFAETSGVILESKVEEHRGSKGKSSYSASIKYEYQVGDRKLQSSNVRFGIPVSMKRAVNEEVARFPEGKVVPVYYDPAKPEEAAIDRSMRGSDLFGLMFLTPFAMVGLGCIGAGITGIREAFGSKEAGGATIFSRAGGRTHVRLPEASPFLYAVVTTGVLSFISIFVVGFSTGMNPSISAVILTWLACVIGGLVVYLREYSRLKLGYYDLIVDAGSAMLGLPRVHGLKQPKAVAFSEVEAVRVKQVIGEGAKTGNSKNRRVTRRYDVMVELVSGEKYKIAAWSDAKLAAALATWLEDKLTS